MAGVLKKLAKKGIENASDFLKSFSEKTYYHGTTEDIEEFKHIPKYIFKGKGRFGLPDPNEKPEYIETEFFHFGTPKAAQDRLDAEMFNLNTPTKNYSGGKRTNWIGQIYPVKLKAKNSLFLKDNKNIPWSPDGIWSRISDELGFSNIAGPSKKKRELAKEKFNIYPEEIEKIETKKLEKYYKQSGEPYYRTKKNYSPENFEFKNIPFGKADDLYEGGKKQWIVDFLNSKGFDSIEYKNIEEDPGSISTIVFEPHQIRSIFGKFNPEDAKSGNILKAVVPVGGLNLLGATDGESEN